MAAAGLGVVLRRVLPLSCADAPLAPPLGGVAAAGVAGHLQRSIGDLPQIQLY